MRNGPFFYIICSKFILTPSQMQSGNANPALSHFILVDLFFLFVFVNLTLFYYVHLSFLALSYPSSQMLCSVNSRHRCWIICKILAQNITVYLVTDVTSTFKCQTEKNAYVLVKKKTFYSLHSTCKVSLLHNYRLICM